MANICCYVLLSKRTKKIASLCLYEKIGGINTGREDCYPAFIYSFFEAGRDSKLWWDDFCYAFLKWNCTSDSIIFPVGKAILPHSIFKFNYISSVHKFCWLKLKIFSKIYFMRKAAAQNLSFNLFLLSYWKCPEDIEVS